MINWLHLFGPVFLILVGIAGAWITIWRAIKNPYVPLYYDYILVGFAFLILAGIVWYFV